MESNLKNFKNINFFKVCILISVFSILFYITQLNNSNVQLINDRLFNQVEFKNVSLFCIIKTTPGSLLNNKTLNLFRVWGHKCDTYRFISVIPNEIRKNVLFNLKNYSNNLEVEMPFYVLQPHGLVVEKYTNITDKLYAAIKYIYKAFPVHEWYLIADDDTYIQMDNLRSFLSTKNSSSPVTYGHDFKISVEYGFHSGGCGFLLSKESFVRVSEKLVANTSFCPNSGIDDVDLNSCLRRVQVYPNKSLDEMGRERFLPVHFLGYYRGPVPEWLFSYSANPPVQGLNCCSDSIVGIHYMNPVDMVRIDDAFKIQAYQSKLLAEKGVKNFQIKFKYVAESYLLMEKIEKNEA